MTALTDAAELVAQNVDRALFRQAMALQAAAVTIVTTDGLAGQFGLTATAVCSVTDSPAMILICINRTSRAHGAFAANGILCVNILSANQETLSSTFGTPGLTVEERFAAAMWTTLKTGAPALVGAAVNLDCRIQSITTAGTHSVFLCQVEDIAMAADEDALVYWNRLYHRVSISECAPGASA